MKIRFSFVSNSSSTSFLVGSKKKNENYININYEVDLDNCSFVRKFDTFEKFERWFDETYYYIKEERVENKYNNELKKRKDKVKKIFEDGGVVYNVDVSTSNNNDIEYEICHNGYNIIKFNKGIKPLHEFEGI